MRTNKGVALTGLIVLEPPTQGFTLGYELEVGLSALTLNA